MFGAALISVGVLIVAGGLLGKFAHATERSTFLATVAFGGLLVVAGIVVLLVD